MLIPHTEKGFTLLETLIVTVIIGILSVILIPQVNNYFIKSKETGIMTDFKDFQSSSETYLRETRGSNINIGELNTYLDKKHEVKINGTVMNTTSVDPWNNLYEVEFGTTKIEFVSFGKESNSSVKRYKMVTYYHSGVVDSCTYGFETHNMKLTKFKELSVDFVCGDSLTLDIPSPPTGPLSAPNNFTATNIKQTSVVLSWDALANATSYSLKRDDVLIYTGSNTSYTDIGLIPNKTYEYAITAKNSTNESPPSLKSVTTESPLLPPPPAIEDGTALHPYLIKNCSDLQSMKNNLTAHYQLANDIDCSDTATWNSGKGFSPIGNNLTKFTGTFDGKGYQINHLTINRPNETYIGLFGYISNATIKNVQLENTDVKGLSNVGGLIGASISSSTIADSYATGNVMGTDAQVGGLIGYNQDSTITNSYASGSVTGTNSVGGLVGINSFSSSTITNSYATGSVIGSHNVGGLIGYNNSSAITYSYATGSVSGTNSVGGLIGYNLSSSTITYSYATGSVTGSNNIGGLVGYHTSSTVANSYYDTQTTGRNDTGKGVGLTADAVKAQASYTAWDFSTIWAIDPSVNNGYPYLKGLKP